METASANTRKKIDRAGVLRSSVRAEAPVEVLVRVGSGFRRRRRRPNGHLNQAIYLVPLRRTDADPLTSRKTGRSISTLNFVPCLFISRPCLLRNYLRKVDDVRFQTR